MQRPGETKQSRQWVWLENDDAGWGLYEYDDVWSLLIGEKLSLGTEDGSSRQSEYKEAARKKKMKPGRHEAATVNCSVWQEYIMSGWQQC